MLHSHYTVGLKLNYRKWTYVKRVRKWFNKYYLIQQRFHCLKFLDRNNKANLEAVEKAIFLLCLDQPPPYSTQTPSVMEMPTSSVTARQCLHGDGTEYNSCNRWFDKIIQVLYTQFKLRKILRDVYQPDSCFSTIYQLKAKIKTIIWSLRLLL